MDAETIFLIDVTLLMIVAGFISLLFARLRQPAVIGYLAAGIILGPAFPLHLVKEVDLVQLLANLGIILLMFSIGLELNLKKLKEMGMSVVLAGSIEVGLMIALGYVLGLFMGWTGVQSLFLGAVMAGSSTAVVTAVLAEMGSIKKEYAGTIMGVLIVEDFASILILTLVSPSVTGVALTLGEVVRTITFITLFIAISLILGMAVVPRALDWINRRFPSETLLLVSLGLCFGMSLISLSLGLSVAIGAFIMGVIISQSACVDRVVSKSAPIKEMFLAVFFVSIGMLIDPLLVWNNLAVALLIAGVFVIGKTVFVSFAAYLSNLEASTSITVGMAMVAMGEFSYVIAQLGMNANVVSPSFYSTVIGASLVTMLIMPLWTRSSARAIELGTKWLPSPLVDQVRQVEKLRSSVRQRLQHSPELRKEVRKEVSWILVDITFLFVVVVLGRLIGFGTALAFLETWVPSIPYIIFVELLIALIIPPTISIIKRVNKISDLLARSAIESGQYSALAARAIYRLFRGVTSLAIFVLSMSMVLPLLDLVRGISSGLLVVVLVIGLLIIYSSWSLYLKTYKTVSSELGKGIFGAGGGATDDKVVLLPKVEHNSPPPNI